MGICVEVNESTNVIEFNNITLENCEAYILLSVDEAAQNVITGDDVGEAFIWGFGLVVLFWSIGYCVRVAFEFLNSTK